MIRDQEIFNQLRDTIRRFVNERLIPAEDRVVEDNAVPAEILREMREMGLYGMTVPEEYGGLGLTTEEEAYIIMELGRASSSTARPSRRNASCPRWRPASMWPPSR